MLGRSLAYLAVAVIATVVLTPVAKKGAAEAVRCSDELKRVARRPDLRETVLWQTNAVRGAVLAEELSRLSPPCSLPALWVEIIDAERS